jgi:hypothetical protein
VFEEDSRRISELERLFTASPADVAIRHELASLLYRRAVEACSLTDTQNRVMTSRRQRELCGDAARRVLQLQVADAELVAAAHSLLVEVDAGSHWVWHPRRAALWLAGGVFAGCLALVAWSMSAQSLPLAGLAAVAGSVVLAGVVLRFRRELWRVEAERVNQIILRHGM